MTEQNARNTLVSTLVLEISLSAADCEEGLEDVLVEESFRALSTVIAHESGDKRERGGRHNRAGKRT